MRTSSTHFGLAASARRFAKIRRRATSCDVAPAPWSPSPAPSPTRKRCVGEGEISESTVGLPAKLSLATNPRVFAWREDLVLSEAVLVLVIESPMLLSDDSPRSRLRARARIGLRVKLALGAYADGKDQMRAEGSPSPAAQLSASTRAGRRARRDRKPRRGCDRSAPSWSSTAAPRSPLH